MISIIEVVLFNLFPVPVAAPVVNMVKNIIPLLGIAITRVSLSIAIGYQKINNSISQKVQQSKLFKLDNIVRMDYYKKLRA